MKAAVLEVEVVFEQYSSVLSFGWEYFLEVEERQEGETSVSNGCIYLELQVSGRSKILVSILKRFKRGRSTHFICWKGSWS